MRGKQNHERERRLRRAQTEAERVLWQLLRDRRLLGHKFRRQHRIGPYFVDFVCVNARLAVEVDGSQHLSQAEYDTARARFLRQAGYRVLRFWNDAVLRAREAALDSIIAALAAHPAVERAKAERGDASVPQPP